LHDVQALFDAALRQQLQGPPCAGIAQCAVLRDRSRHPARRKPHAGFPGEESERTGAAAGSCRRTLPCRVQRHPVVCRRRHAAGQITVADIALYGYTHVADRCDFDLATFPAIRGWLRRMEQTPGFVTMDAEPTPEVEDSASIAAGV